MEGEPYNTMQSSPEKTHIESAPKSMTLPEISFLPESLLNKKEISSTSMRDRCALIGLVVGVLAVISWIVMLFGAVFAIIGIALSTLGLKSNYKKHARIGLVLSLVGLSASFWYLFAASHGMINYNYFTSEFWGATATSSVPVK